jgi:hypothetical protein
MRLRSKVKRLVKSVADIPRIRRLRQLEGIHRGEDAVIIGMGPSLRPEDLDRFKGFRTFACNKIYLAFENTEWRPDYYSVCDILVAQNNRDAILNADFRDAVPIHSEYVWPELRSQRNAVHYKYGRSIAEWSPGNPTNLSSTLVYGVHSAGYSVIIEQILIAYVMGFQNVHVVGVDFSFSGGTPTESTCVSGQILKSEGETNHFHPDYRKPGETWTVPKMKEQEHAYKFCLAAFEEAGRTLSNASRTSALTVLPRVPFDETFTK